MDIANLIQSYGYAAVGVGTFLEGESVLLAAGAAAFHGYLKLPAVMVIATLASFLGDQLFFYLGRRHGNQLLGRFPALAPRVARMRVLLERHHVPVILSVRFLYGLRIAGPMAIGMSGVHWSRFLVLNLLGAVIWAVLIAGVGFGLGQGLAYSLGGFDADEAWLLTALLMPLVLWWLANYAKKKRSS
ncbi:MULTISPECIES: DedA family protein [Burkholderiaceae]|jgi:membrane protein DedA with SNARE-associated domain|uniref:Membrane protein n=1 Tax=Pandoraea apista TaxID=93218 RepID=A0A5E5P6C9_9BURK|nr:MULTISPECIES: DedA family protein [Burkholderiaceae]MBR8052094.1 DedA family protein [Burkholderia vietnamiensis]VVG71900.1 membrane protein [Pandoraea apista]HDR9283074.1 DedA family protein [Burkholderia vietnamiensis]